MRRAALRHALVHLCAAAGASAIAACGAARSTASAAASATAPVDVTPVGAIAGPRGGVTDSRDYRVAAARPALATRTLIPTARLDAEPASTVYDVVAHVWPQLLRPSPLASLLPSHVGPPVGVYMNETYLGGPDQLQSFRSGAVASVYRLSSAEEYMRWGRSHPSGALVLTLRR